MEDDCEMTPEASSSSNETPSEAENVHEQPTPEFLQRKIYFLSKLLQSSPTPLTYLHWLIAIIIIISVDQLKAMHAELPEWVINKVS